MRRLLFPCALFLCGCPENLEKQSEIVKLRVLAVQAEPAELIVDPAQPLPRATLTALAVEPSDAPVSVEFALCTLQDPVPPPTIDCPGTQGIPLPPSGPVSATLDLADPQVISLALQLSQGADSGASLAQGIPVLVGFRATAPAHGLPDGGPPGTGGGDLQILQGLTTLTVRSPGAPPNGNPSIAALQIGEAEISPDGGTAVPASTVQRLTPVPDPGSKEPAGGAIESLGYSFFASAGSISSLRSADTTATGQPADTFVDWTSPADAPLARLWVVVRDGRGGVGWIAGSVQVTPPAGR
jgi:hypothetical protein